MKQFAFPISVLCADVNEHNECTDLLKSIGYGHLNINPAFLLVATNEIGFITNYKVGSDNKYNHHRHYIDHYNPSLIRAIASTRKNDTWQTGEIAFTQDNHFVGYAISEGQKVRDGYCHRPTLSEICKHHGYYIDGQDIKRIEPNPINANMILLAALSRILFEPEEPEHIITNDGVKIYKGQRCWFVDVDYEVFSFEFTKKSKFHNDSINVFSTKEAAEAWVKAHKPFKPVSVTLTCDTPEELRWLWHLLNCSENQCRNNFNGNELPYSIKKHNLHWREVDRVVKEVGIDIYES